MESPEFLKQKYDLHKAPEVERAALRTEKRTGEKVPQKPEERIQNYLDRFKEIVERKDPEKRERGLRALKEVLHDKFVIKPEEVPEGYFELQQRIAREQGHGEVEITEEMRDQLTEVIIVDQESSLDNWVDYLSSPDATYPDWLKYYAFRSVLGLGEYDKEKKQFTKRSEGTVKPFPDINREALAYVLDAIEKKHGRQLPDLSRLNEEEKKEFQKLLESENFGKLYAWAIEKVTPTEQNLLATTDGKWIKYGQNSDHMPLVASLQGHGTGWCTAGESTAEAQLKGGDFYVYYSLDKEGTPTIPRAAIRMQGNNIAEVRGIAPGQNLDPYIAPVVQEKMNQFPDGAQYEKKAGDMKALTQIEHKTKKGQPLSKGDLLFLYELNASIEGFGYQRDPRIAELRAMRNPEADMPIVFECAKEQIARTVKEINKDTKAYVGKLGPGIFTLVSQYKIEHLYTSFPEGKITQYHIEIGGKTKDELAQEFTDKKIYISDYVRGLLERDFSTSKTAEHADLVRLTMKDIGFPSGATTDQIYKRAEELGLELCPPETALALRLFYSGGDHMYIAMKQITGRGGVPDVFHLSRYEGRLGLDTGDAGPGYGWYEGDRFVFRIRKPPHQSAAPQDSSKIIVFSHCFEDWCGGKLKNLET